MELHIAEYAKAIYAAWDARGIPCPHAESWEAYRVSTLIPACEQDALDSQEVWKEWEKMEKELA